MEYQQSPEYVIGLMVWIVLSMLAPMAPFIVALGLLYLVLRLTGVLR